MITNIFPLFNNIKMNIVSPPQLIYIPKAILYTLLIILQLPFHWIELVLYKNKIQRHRLKHDPIIILGYWRSGTTYTQRLLCLNNNIAYLPLYESIFPLGSIIHSVIFKKILNNFLKILNLKHPLHKTTINMNFPSEEDIALCCSSYPHTPMWAHIYSKRAKYFFNKPLISEKRSKESFLFKKMYTYLTKKLSFTNPKKILLLKSPCNTTKINEILEIFPNAKFIYISRNIKDTYFSNMKLLKTNKFQWVQHMNKEERTRLFTTSYSKIISKYNDTKNKIPINNLIEIKFEDLYQTPNEHIQHIYSKFRIPFSNSDKCNLKNFLKKNHGKHKHEYKQKVPDEVLEKIKQKI